MFIIAPLKDHLNETQAAVGVGAFVVVSNMEGKMEITWTQGTTVYFLLMDVNSISYGYEVNGVRTVYWTK